MNRKWLNEGLPGKDGSMAGYKGRTAAQRRPCSPLADQVELRWRMAVDVTTLRLLRTMGGSPIDTAALTWIERAVLDELREPRPVAELRMIAAEWRRRRRKALPGEGQDWAEVMIVGPMDRPAPSRWWRWRRGEEPTPPRSCGPGPEID